MLIAVDTDTNIIIAAIKEQTISKQWKVEALNRAKNKPKSQQKHNI
jgi:hypothetical protein